MRGSPAGTAHLQDFYELTPHKFQNKTNGVTPRRWLAWCNPGLAALITETLGTDTWPNDLNLLTGLRQHADDKEFQKKWRAIKHENKAKLAAKIKVRPPMAGPMRAIYVTANCDNCHVHSLPESCSSPWLGIGVLADERATVRPHVLAFKALQFVGWPWVSLCLMCRCPASCSRLWCMLLQARTGVDLPTDPLYDIQIKRIHEYKRQYMNILSIIYRYHQLKTASPEERKKFVPRVTIFGGKAASAYYMAKKIVRLINRVGSVVNNDPDVMDLLKVGNPKAQRHCCIGSIFSLSPAECRYPG